MTEQEQAVAIVQAWVRQMVADDALVAVVAAAGRDATIDVTLSASKGRVRARPTVVVGSGPAPMVDPANAP